MNEDQCHALESAALVDHGRADLLRSIAEQKSRLDRQAEAIIELSMAIQAQARLLNEVIKDLYSSGAAGTMAAAQRLQTGRRAAEES